MRKIAISYSPIGQLDRDKVLACIPGPASERPCGFMDAGVVISPLVVKLPFDTKPRSELIVVAWFAIDEPISQKIQVLINPSVEEKNLLWNTTSPLDFDKALTLIHHPKLIDISPNQAFKLIPCRIPKPWGEEVWFSGIEERGISQVELSTGKTFDLPLLLQALGPQATANGKPPILLKILEPKPNPLTGSLYYELHKEKQEVYIVSQINPKSWPNGTGRMKYGISKTKRDNFRSEQEFLDAFQSTCLAYEKTRQNIDEKINEFKILENIMPEQTISDEKWEQWNQMLPSALRQEDEQLRQEIESFVGWLDLKIGDVVQVETLVPHSLQYGITVIEFQTPVYERLIITFNQKVLTQNHWDIEKAFEIMKPAYPELKPLEKVFQNESLIIEKAVDFSDFDVLRIKQFTHEYHLELVAVGHTMIFALNSPLQVHGQTSLSLMPGESCFIPTGASKLLITTDNPDCTWLLGREKI